VNIFPVRRRITATVKAKKVSTCILTCRIGERD